MSSARSDLEFIKLSRSALCEFHAGRAPEVRTPALSRLVARFESPGIEKTLEAACLSADFGTVERVFLLRNEASAEIKELKKFEKRVINEAKALAKALKKKEQRRQFGGGGFNLAGMVRPTYEAKIEFATEVRERCERAIKQCNKGLRDYSRKHKFRTVPRAGSKLEAFLAWEKRSQRKLRERESKKQA